MNQLEKIEKYYSEKISTHGATPKGVDWNGVDSQLLRFKQLTKIIEWKTPFTINDFGCGYGALYEFIRAHNVDFEYFGNDISPVMIKRAENIFTSSNANFFVSNKPVFTADYTIASGIFNVFLNEDESEWKRYFLSQLHAIDEKSTKGFAFNCLTSYSDVEKKKDYLYYADPCEIFDYCKNNFSRNVALLHDYDIYEFTILVRKS